MRQLCIQSLFLIGLALASVLASFIQPSTAQASENTLDRIRREGVFRIGYGTTPPFSYRLGDGTVTGYSVELCRMVVDDVKQQLGLERVEIVYVPRTPIDRVQLLNEGRYDLECEASTNTEERRRSAAFALSHFFTATRFVTLSENSLGSIDDLKGHTLAVARGTVNIGQIGKLNRDRRMQIALVSVETIKDAFELVSAGRVSAFVMDEILLKSMIAETGHPSLYRMSDEAVSQVLPYGFMMRKDDKAFQQAVNSALRRIYAKPEIMSLYDRWFRGPVPGVNLRLDVPMSPELSAHFASFR